MSTATSTEETAPRERGQAAARQEGAVTRLLATLVLIPTVPMLLASVAALALFYLAPTRFGNLLSRLPGDDVIRMALVFAPATLLATAILALLYAIEAPPEAAPRTREEGRAAPARWSALQLARWALTLAVPALFLAVSVSVLSFVAPSRFESFIERLPGTSYLWMGIRAAPALALGVVLAAVSLALFSGGRAGQRDLLRLSVGLILLPTVPMFLLSLAALAFFQFFPGRFASLIARLPEEAFLRLVLLAAPAILIVVLILAGLYLWDTPARMAGSRKPPVEALPQGRFESLRPVAAVWVLVGGLILTAALGVGVLGVLFLLVVV